MSKCCCKIKEAIENLQLTIDPRYDVELIPIRRCSTQGDRVYEVCEIVYLEGVQQSTSTFWLVNGVKTNVEPPGLYECEETSCNPWMGSGTADVLPTEPITDLTIITPNGGCNCELTIVTSIGTMNFPSLKEVRLPSTDCPYTLEDIQKEGDCELSDILWLASRKK